MDGKSTKTILHQVQKKGKLNKDVKSLVLNVWIVLHKKYLRIIFAGQS